MPASIPDAATLLAAAAADFEREVLPALTGPARFRARVILNAMRLVRRELETGPAVDAAELGRLRELLPGMDAELPALRAELARRIEAGTLALDDPALLAHLRASLRESLAINHPGWTEA